jgi:hypothetical protein
MRPRAEFEEVQRLLRQGGSDFAVARLTGVPRSTVRRWRRAKAPPGAPVLGPVSWQPRGASYCYVLGLYLGDGHVTHHRGSSRTVVVSLDLSYPRIIEEAARELAAVFAPARVRSRERSGAALLSVSSPAIDLAVPQHGPGRKHLRTLALRDWQRDLTREHPRALLRGLIHSDGCRTINRFTTKLPSGRVVTYSYPRYFFSNLSPDIRAIFCEHCELLGIRWTQSNARNISVSHRDSVAVLDSFIGPKT